VKIHAVYSDQKTGEMLFVFAASAFNTFIIVKSAEIDLTDEYPSINFWNDVKIERVLGKWDTKLTNVADVPPVVLLKAQSKIQMLLAQCGDL
jgi:hypothetical protein